MTLQTFWPMLKKELYEQYRTYRTLIALVILLLLGLSAPIVTKLTPDLLQNLGGGIKIVLPPQTATDSLNSYIKNMVQLPAIMIILLTMGCVADERNHGTAATVLTKPVPRAVFVLAKFLAYCLLIFTGTVLTAVGAYFYTYQLFSALPSGPFLLLNLALFIFFMLLLALTVLASVLFRNAIAAGGVAFAGFLVLSILPALNATVAQALPSALFGSTQVTQLLAGTLPLGDILWPLGFGLGLTLVLISIACLVFQRQEI
ncbi:MAG TPA: ABC transporter permease subunit [Ktedonobacteraceae bacterium]|nr:ABC transporter permease subunit [Ktedonobacteraceae bacterium]